MGRRKAYKDKYPEFVIKGEFDAKVVDVYDGDTFTVVFDPFPLSQYSNDYWFKIRLLGINCPEIKVGRNEPNREEIMKAGREARDYASDLVLNKTVHLHITGKGKFGRLLADVYVDGIEGTLNQHLVDKGYAIEFMRN